MSVFVSPIDYVSSGECKKIVFRVGRQDYTMWCKEHCMDIILQIVQRLNSAYQNESQKYSHLDEKNINTITAIEILYEMIENRSKELMSIKNDYNKLQTNYNLLKEKLKNIENTEHSNLFTHYVEKESNNSNNNSIKEIDEKELESLINIKLVDQKEILMNSFVEILSSINNKLR